MVAAPEPSVPEDAPGAVAELLRRAVYCVASVEDHLPEGHPWLGGLTSWRRTHGLRVVEAAAVLEDILTSE